MNQKIGYIYGGLRQVTSDDRRLESTKEYDAYKLLQIASHHLCSLSSVNTINAYQTLKVDYRILIEKNTKCYKKKINTSSDYQDLDKNTKFGDHCSYNSTSLYILENYIVRCIMYVWVGVEKYQKVGDEMMMRILEATIYRRT